MLVTLAGLAGKNLPIKIHSFTYLCKLHPFGENNQYDDFFRSDQMHA